MPGEVELAVVLLSAAVLGVYGYAAYAALSIRRRLSGDTYRRQGLGAAVVVILFGVLTETLILSGVSPTRTVFALLISWMVAWGVFYWVDASIRAARYSDPILRDTFHWSRLRIFLWAYSFVGPAFTVAVFLLLVFTSLSILPYLQSPIPSTAILLGVVFAPFLVTFVSGAVALPIVARRAADVQLRRHLLWAALYIAVLLSLYVVSSFFTGVTYALAQGLVLVIAGYLLYRSARALVPIYRLGSSDPS